MTRFAIKKGDKLICLTTTRTDGSTFKCFYLFETAADWNLYNASGKQKSNVVRTYEEYDGESTVVTNNGD